MSAADAACRGKTGYLSWDAANKAMSRNRFKPDDREGVVQPYKCRFCHHWHLGKSRFGKKRSG